MNSSGGERHGAIPRPAVAAVILVAEGHAALVEAEQPAVRDGDAVGVAGEIGEHRLRPGEGRLGIDEPVLFLERREMCGEGLSVTQAVDLAEERQPARCVSVGERRPGRAAGTGGTAPAPARGTRACTAPSASPSSEIPPPGTIMWTCGWWVIAEPQLWSTAVAPMRAPRCRGSAAIVSSVSAVVRNRDRRPPPCSDRRSGRSRPAA